QLGRARVLKPFRIAQEFQQRWILERDHHVVADNARVGCASAGAECRQFHQRFPLSACSRSSASNKALKLPSPNPFAPLRSITSKKTVGRFTTGLEKICSR